MYKKYLLILIILAVFIQESIQATTRPESQKKKKQVKGKKEQKNTVRKAAQAPQKTDQDFDQQLSCSCSCETLQIPKKGKKAELKVDNRQSNAFKRQASGEIKSKKVPLKEGESRFKSLKKPSIQPVKQLIPETGAKQQTIPDVKNEKNKQKIKSTQKPREETKSKRKESISKKQTPTQHEL